MLIFLGIVLILFVLRDVFYSAIPRRMSTRYCIAPFLLDRILWRPFGVIASAISKPELRDEVLGLFAPFALLVLLIVWICFLTAGFALISLGLSSHYSPPMNSLFESLYVSAQSVLLIGASPYYALKTHAAKFVMISAGLIGMLLTASVLSIMFGLNSAIHPREALVCVVSNLAGVPPSGIVLLETFSRMHAKESLDTFFDKCHYWCAEVLESHIAFPILPFFRSNDTCTSWLTSLGAVLEAIALLLSVDPGRHCFSARTTFHLGTKLVRDFAATFSVDALNQQEIGDDEFHQLYVRLQSAGYSSTCEEESKANFRQLRLEYFPTYSALCEYLAVPSSPSIWNQTSSCDTEDKSKHLGARQVKSENGDLSPKLPVRMPRTLDKWTI
jgi:hypothetical protein